MKKKNFNGSLSRIFVNTFFGVLLVWWAITMLPFLVIDLHAAYANAETPEMMVAVSLGLVLGVALVAWVYRLLSSFFSVAEVSEGEDVVATSPSTATAEHVASR